MTNESRPVYLLIDELVRFISDSRGEEVAHRAVQWALAQRARELGMSKREQRLSLSIPDDKHEQRSTMLQESNLKNLRRFGLRADHFISLKPRIWERLANKATVQVVAGSHIGTWIDGGDASKHVASLHDLKGLCEFVGALHSDQNFDVRIDPILELPPVDAGSKAWELHKKIEDKKQVFLQEKAQSCSAVFSFGAPNTCLTTGVIASFFNVPKDDVFPKIRLPFAQNQLEGSLFYVGPALKGGMIRRSDNKEIVGEVRDDLEEDFGFVGILEPTEGSLLGFAAGIGHLGTLAGARAITEFIEMIAIEDWKFVRRPLENTHMYLAIVRVCTEKQSDGLKVDRNHTLRLETHELGWNFIEVNNW